ncbi:hypothetical protein VaNZ11_014080 [Volvox africanus]|uniref:Protein kinase domain-containing protein n=1 Tax=Volvox africanus TaxID=51714 RepID=A0ABQ5SJ07_9CHLO|nr:hypothetical protein VaNZ11_014080 [Volvox africanus]
MWYWKPCRLQLLQLYCQLLLLAFLGSRELGTRHVEGQVEDCTNLLKVLPTNLSVLQPCVTGSAGAPVVLDGSRRFEPAHGEARPTLDLAFKSSTVLLVPPRAVLEIISANITGARLSVPATVVVQPLLAVSVQPTASLLFTDVALETDCSTLLRYQKWVAESKPTKVSVISPGGDVFVSSWTWREAGISLVDCTITCRKPPARVVSIPLGGRSNTTGSEATVVTVSNDVDLYNALALATLYVGASVQVVVDRDMVMSSPLWAVQEVPLLRNISIVGAAASSGSGSNGTTGSAIWKPVLDFQDQINGVFLAEGVVLSLDNLMLTNAGMVFGYPPAAYAALGFVSSFLWFFDFKRIVVSQNKPLNQLVVTNCDIISYQYDVEHMGAWAWALTTNVEPVKSQADAFRTGVYDIQLNYPGRIKSAVEFATLDAYSMLYRNTCLVPDTAANMTLTARGAGARLYDLEIPLATTAVPVWTHSDLKSILALAQLFPCSPYSNTTTYIYLFANISLDQSKWPYSGYNISCNVTISGSPDKEGGTWLNFSLLSHFITLSDGATLTFRHLTLFNMPSQLGSYSIGNLTEMTFPMWPVNRLPGALLILIDCTVVLPAEEYRMLADVAGGQIRWSAFNSSIKAYIGTHSMSVVLMTSFGMVISNSLITDSIGNIPYTSLLGPNIYGTAGMSPSLPPPSGAEVRTAAAEGGGSRHKTPASVLAVAVAVPIAVVAFAIVLVVAAFIHLRHIKGRNGGNAFVPPGEANSPGVQSAAVTPEGGSKGLVVSGICAGGSSNNTPHSEDASGLTDAQAGERAVSLVKASESESGTVPMAPPLHVELHQLILDFAREIEDKHLNIHDALGSGGFATVYRGTWRGLDVAVKVIEFQDRAAGNERLQARAMTEAAIAANIQHANIVTTYSYDIRPVVPNEEGQDTPSSTLLGIGPAPEGGPPPVAGSVHPRRRSGSSDQSNGSQAPRMWKLYLIQEFCEVGSLRVALENRMFHLPDGLPNMPMILRLMLDVVRGLQHLHRKNIVHGDLTPGNILLKANMSRPGTYTAKLADFGLSVKMDPSQTSVDNNRTGTPFYASPEVRQHGNLTKASDLYALGVILWEIWHGRPCYQRVRGVKHYIHASGYPSYLPHCPAAYADLTDRCLRRALEERPQLDEVYDVLRNLLGSAASGLSSGSEGGTSSSPSHEWPFVANACIPGVGLAPAALAAHLVGTPAVGGGVAAGAGFGASGLSTAAGDTGDGTGGTAGGSTSSWFRAAPAARFQAAVPPAIPPGRSTSERSANAGAAGAAAAAAAPQPPAPGFGWGQPGCGGGGRVVVPAQVAGGGSTWPRAGSMRQGPVGLLNDATMPPAAVHRMLQQQQQRLIPTHARLLYGVVQEAAPFPLEVDAGTNGPGTGGPGGPTPMPAAAVLAPAGGVDDGVGSGTKNQVPAQWPSGIEATAAGQQPSLRAEDVQLGLEEGPVVGDVKALAAPARFSISLRLGTADEHFVTAPGSNGELPVMTHVP